MDVEVATGIRRLSQGVVNFYLIEDGGRFTLVDAGAPRDWDLLAATLSRLGAGVEDLEAVLLTHAHSDHTGFAEHARTGAGAAIWVHGADEAVAKGAKPPKNSAGLARYLLRLEAYRTLISLSRRGGSKIVPIVEVSTFVDGQTIDVPGRPRVVHTPGHTAGSSADPARGPPRGDDRRRRGDAQPADRSHRPADHAVGPEPRHRSGARLPRGDRGSSRGPPAPGARRAVDVGGGRGGPCRAYRRAVVMAGRVVARTRPMREV